MFLHLLLGAQLYGRLDAFHGITLLYRKKPTSLREDLPKFFVLVAENRVNPLIAANVPPLQAMQALELLATGTVEDELVPTNA
jgi:hypothetical protein